MSMSLFKSIAVVFAFTGLILPAMANSIERKDKRNIITETSSGEGGTYVIDLNITKTKLDSQTAWRKGFYGDRLDSPVLVSDIEKNRSGDKVSLSSFPDARSYIVTSCPNVKYRSIVLKLEGISPRNFDLDLEGNTRPGELVYVKEGRIIINDKEKEIEIEKVIHIPYESNDKTLIFNSKLVSLFQDTLFKDNSIEIILPIYAHSRGGKVSFRWDLAGLGNLMSEICIDQWAVKALV